MDLQGSQLARAQSRHIGLGFSNWNIRLRIRFWQTSNLTRTNPFKRCGGIVPDLNECFNREAFKYCLADFVRERGNSPFRTIFYLKDSADFSGTPPPRHLRRVRQFDPRKISPSRTKNDVFVLIMVKMDHMGL